MLSPEIDDHCWEGIDDFWPGGSPTTRTGVNRGDFQAQAREVFNAIKAFVEAGGGTLDNTVKIDTYGHLYLLPGRETSDRRRVLRPEGSSIDDGGGALAHPDYLIEVEAIAVI
jgi:enamine deaminase RidA (YjgF/YER057c/UK114 family)